ncbi:hypothetical protein PR048_000197 [Dryococelus australis]|uniref:C-type lectin domain-containing protein n=1 Tax=Dryococelus australis TaxID=614101 RepID=A0ABQ9IDZ1_9NEOP|nr:hypothetical protein PR048_000197 [Dryococelus australis]
MKVLLLLAVVLVSAQADTVLSSGSTGYEYFPGYGFYKFYLQPQTWSEAVQTCLSTPQSSADTPISLESPSRHTSMPVTPSSTPPGTSSLSMACQLPRPATLKWDSGEPNNADGIAETCGSITREGQLNDISCYDTLAFICEMKYPSSTQIH